MSTFAFSLVALAALLHAVWNAVLKGADERTLVLASISATHVVMGTLLLSQSAMPSAESWPYIVASTIIHYAYYAFLFVAYRIGDLSQVYPIARGLAPLLVAVGALLFADENLTLIQWVSVGTISFGIGALAFTTRGETSTGAIAAAVATGLMIASYTVVDGIGVRLSGSPFGYAGWLFVLEAPVIAFVLFRRKHSWNRRTLKTIGLGLLGGFFAATAYGLVLYAKTLAPLAAVSAIRESSVIIAALIGVIVFGERPWPSRIICAVLVGAGVAALSSSP